MAEVSSQDRLQPSLLDRLTDLEPRKEQESQEMRLLSQRQLRRSLVRDLEWLLNTGRMATIVDLESFPAVRGSVLNYGVPDLAGTLLSSVEVDSLAAELKEAILLFEPRINRHSLQITGEVDEDTSHRNAISFEISAEMWGDPSPVHLMLKTEMDLETGQVAVQDFGS